MECLILGGVYGYGYGIYEIIMLMLISNMEYTF